MVGNSESVEFGAIGRARLEILTVIDHHGHYVDMNDGFSYHYPGFLDSVVGDRFAVVREMNSPYRNGLIAIALKI